MKTDISKEAILAKLRPCEVVAGVDPGDKTGVYNLSKAVCWSATYDYKQLLVALENSLQRPTLTIVVEQFIDRPASFARTQIAAKVCGALDHYAYHYGLKIVYQSPQVIKTMLPGAVEFRKAGWAWEDQHEFDALRHAVYYLLTRS